MAAGEERRIKMMINRIKVTATYQSATDVPRIGQRKRMRVNGRFQQMTLNELNVERRWAYDDEAKKTFYEFDSEETWGEYNIG